MKLNTKRIYQLIVGITLITIFNTIAVSEIREVCKLEYNVKIDHTSITIEFSESIQPYKFELIEVRKGIVESTPVINATSVKYNDLSSGEYFIRLIGIDCQQIIGSKKDRSKGLIIK